MYFGYWFSPIFFVVVVKYNPQVFNLATIICHCMSVSPAARAGQQGTLDTKQGVGMHSEPSAVNCLLLELIPRHSPQQGQLPRHTQSCGPAARLRAQLLSKGRLLLCRIHNHLQDFPQTFSKGKQTIQQAVHDREWEEGVNQWHQCAAFPIKCTEVRSTLM